ncbi:MAG TPA: dihydroxyacetone kinase subunit DhaL [Actinomycetota bacterium]|nr:dihydroxyacetone kinase subunit DhaL [Actinomycetota bacterium]
MRRWITASAAAIAVNRDTLTQLDAAIGDADHGVNMDRGFQAAVAPLATSDGAPPGELLRQVGATLMFRVGGAAGPLYGTAFREIGSLLGDAPVFGPAELLAALRAGLDGVRSLGAAVEGDKTMVDAWLPAIGALDANLGRVPAADAFRAMREAAEAGAVATTPMQARKGRASYLGPRSVGHQDPGATSSAIVFGALERAVASP